MSEPYVNADGIPVWVKHTDDNGPWGLDFAGLFPVGDVLATTVWPAVAGITFGTKIEAGTVASIHASGGTVGTDYTLSCTATSSSGVVKTRSLILAVRAR